MPYNPDGSFSILNEIGTGYACNNALVPLLGSDLDDIATSINIANILSVTNLIGAGVGAIKITSGTITAAANFDIVLGTLINTYRKFSFVFTNLSQSTNGNLRALCSTDGGATFDTNDSYAFAFIGRTTVGVTTTGNDTDTTGGLFIGWGGSVATDTSDFTFDCYNLSGTTDYKKFYSAGFFGSDGTYYTMSFGSMYFGSVSPVNALQFFDDNSGVISCNYAIYGWI